MSISAAVLTFSLIGIQDPAEQPQALMLSVGEPNGGFVRIMMRKALVPLDVPKRSPKEFEVEGGKVRFEFPWITSVFGRETADADFRLRMRVYSQARSIKENYDLPTKVGRMAGRLWSLSGQKLKLDQPLLNEMGLVDWYLCWGGKAGGEQLFDEEISGTGSRMKVNTIYIYDLASFSDPVEMAREVAHEYGHAILPAVGGFETPEEWGNGYLGERVFLRWMRDLVKGGQFAPIDAMDASAEGLDAWVKKHVDPLVKQASSTRPEPRVLGAKGSAAMNAYMGLALYIEDLFGSPFLGRAMKLNGATTAADFPASIVQAVEEKPTWTIFVPKAAGGGPVWIPLPPKSTVGKAKIIERVGSWARIQPDGGPITLKIVSTN